MEARHWNDAGLFTLDETDADPESLLRPLHFAKQYHRAGTREAHIFAAGHRVDRVFRHIRAGVTLGAAAHDNGQNRDP